MKKQNKGITLIALVITIVVLVILVGVSVSVAINTGLIGNSKTAVEDYDKAQQYEEILLTDVEVNLDFITEKIPYKFKNGYLTGVQFNDGMTEKVSELESRLPTGYTIHSSDNEDIDNKEGTNVITGMVLRKNNVKAGRIVVFGDINKDGTIDNIDTFLGEFLKINLTDISNYDDDYDIIAMDVNHDSIVDNQDVEIIGDHYLGNKIINQLVEVENKAENIIIKSKQWYKDNYINELPETFTKKYKVYYSEQYNRYQIDVKSGTVTAATFLADLQDSDARLDVFDESSKQFIEGVTGETLITRVAKLYVDFNYFSEVDIIYIFGI